MLHIGSRSLARYFKIKLSKYPDVGFSFFSCSRNSFIKFLVKTLSGGGIVVDRIRRLHAIAIGSVLFVSLIV